MDDQLAPIFSLKQDVLRDVLKRLKHGWRQSYGAARKNDKGCWLAQKAPHNGDGTGYIRVKVNKERTEYYAHHLAVAIGDGREKLRLVYQRGDLPEHPVSHLCHERKCFNPAHLIVEPAVVNRSRIACAGFTFVACPCGCNHIFNPCKHEPQCILSNPFPPSSPTAI
jgi:hypothetical protein